MNTYRVKVSTTEVFEIDAESAEDASMDWFDGAVVHTGEVRVESVTWIDKADPEAHR